MNNVLNSYGTMNILYDRFDIFYKDYNVDDGMHAGEDAEWRSITAQYSDSKKRLNEEDKKVIQATFNFTDAQLEDFLKQFESGQISITVDNMKFSVSGNRSEKIEILEKEL